MSNLEKHRLTGRLLADQLINHFASTSKEQNDYINILTQASLSMLANFSLIKHRHENIPISLYVDNIGVLLIEEISNIRQSCNCENCKKELDNEIKRNSH